MEDQRTLLILPDSALLGLSQFSRRFWPNLPLLAEWPGVVHGRSEVYHVGSSNAPK